MSFVALIVSEILYERKVKRGNKNPDEFETVKNESSK